jgi:hypothetical protein
MDTVLQQKALGQLKPAGENFHRTIDQVNSQEVKTEDKDNKFTTRPIYDAPPSPGEKVQRTDGYCADPKEVNRRCYYEF